MKTKIEDIKKAITEIKLKIYKHCTYFVIAFIIGYIYFKIIEYLMHIYYYHALFFGFYINVIFEVIKIFTYFLKFKHSKLFKPIIIINLYETFYNLIFSIFGTLMLFIIKEYPI